MQVTPTKKLTARQSEILAFIEAEIANGLPPTQEEIREHFGFKSRNSVQNFLDALDNKGYIQREEGKSRSIKLVHIHTS